MINLERVFKSRDIILPTKLHIVKPMVFPVVRKWELYYKEGWVLKNWCFQTVAMVKILESPLDSKEIKPVDPNGNQPWIFTGRTDAEAGAPIPDAVSQLIGKDSNAGKDWRQKKGASGGRDGKIASLTQWTSIWANSRRQWRIEEPGMLQSTGSQRVRHDLVTEQQQRSTVQGSRHTKTLLRKKMSAAQRLSPRNWPWTRWRQFISLEGVGFEQATPAELTFFCPWRGCHEQR